MKQKQTKKQKTYYMQLKTDHKIPKYLKTYKKDFLEYDKKRLTRYKGKFILGVRPTGTNLFQFTDTFKKEVRTDPREEKAWRKHFTTWTVRSPYQKRFFYGSKGKVKEVSKAEAKRIFEREIKVAKGEPRY